MLFRFKTRPSAHDSVPFYIFLDIDGVLNRKEDWRHPFTLNRSCVSVFSTLVNKLDAEVRIVLSSTWRAGMSPDGQSAAQYSHLENVLGEYGLKIYDRTPVSDKGRQKEIEYYIRRHNVHRYLIIDDDPSLFEDPGSLCIYFTDHLTGLQSSDVKKISKITEN